MGFFETSLCYVQSGWHFAMLSASILSVKAKTASRYDGRHLTSHVGLNIIKLRYCEMFRVILE